MIYRKEQIRLESNQHEAMGQGLLVRRQLTKVSQFSGPYREMFLSIPSLKDGSKFRDLEKKRRFN